MTRTLTDAEVVFTLPDSDTTNGHMFKWQADPGEIDYNRWYRTDERVVRTTPGKNDGIIQGGVDGEFALDKSDLKSRNAGFDHVKINEFRFNAYMGGRLASSRNCQLFVDELVVSPTQINNNLEQS